MADDSHLLAKFTGTPRSWTESPIVPGSSPNYFPEDERGSPQVPMWIPMPSPLDRGENDEDKYPSPGEPVERPPNNTGRAPPTNDCEPKVANQIDIGWVIGGFAVLLLILLSLILIKFHRKQPSMRNQAKERRSKSSVSISIIPRIAERSNSETMSCGGTRALKHGIHHDFFREVTTSTTAPTSEWALTEALGRGRYGSVHLAVDLEQGAKDTHLPQVFAIKRATFGDNEVGELVKNKETRAMYDEIAIFDGLNHENIVKFYGSALCDRSIVLFLEYCPLGDLSSTVREHGAFNLVTTRSMIQQLLEAIRYLHSMDIIHRDIKGRNILLSLHERSSKLCLKLADFGCSMNLNDRKQRNFGGTVHWMAPEVFHRSQRDNAPLRALDIWSFGITVLEMMTTRPVLSRVKPPELAKILKYEVQRFKDSIPEIEHRGLSQLVQKCLAIDPLQRPTAGQLLQTDPFVLYPLANQQEQSELVVVNDLMSELKKKWTQRMLKTESIKRRCAKLLSESNY